MTSELKTSLPDRVCIWDADKSDPTSTRGWTTSFSEGHQNTYVRANAYTRAVPDVPELVTVTYDADSTGKNIALVSRKQAAALIAAKDGRITDYKNLVDALHKRAEAAEAKLAEREAQATAPAADMKEKSRHDKG